MITSQKESWTTLLSLLDKQHIGYIDLAVAERILANLSEIDEAYATFIAHLSLASRQGHMCLQIYGNEITPSLEQLWEGNSDEEIDPEMTKKIGQLIIQGSQSIPLQFPLHKINNSFYLHKNWILDSHFAKELSLILAHKTNAVICSEETFESLPLLPEQKQAVLHGCTHALTLITGGPGTGKTHTAGFLVKTLWNSLSDQHKSEFKIALAAPTGKAAANLQSSIQRAVKDLPEFPETTAKTLHALLEIGKRSYMKAERYLDADLLLVDECSMIDIDMMTQLLKAIRPGARCILLGDPYQLPPIESGTPFYDLVELFQSNTLQMNPVCTLTHCMRAELRGIVEFAEKIKHGTVSQSPMEGIELKFLNESTKEIQKLVLSYAESFYPLMQEVAANPMDQLRAFSRFRILSPLRQGALGVDALNHHLFQMFRIKAHETLIVPIMMTKNDYELDLFNGEIGLLVKHLVGEKYRDYALFPSRTPDGAMRKIAEILLPPYEYAYCLSVHKSQGSEFDHVVLLLPEGSASFGREGAYTGITRAKKKIEVWTTEKTLQRTLLNTGKRLSGIKELLWEKK